MARWNLKKWLGARVYTHFAGTTGGVGRGNFAANDAMAPQVDLNERLAGAEGDFLAVTFSGLAVVNPDEILRSIAPQKVGGSLSTDFYELHRRMRKSDLKYNGLIQTRKTAVLCKEWRVVPNPYDADRERAAAVARFVAAALDRIRDFHGDLSELLDAIALGFSVSEILWEQGTLPYGEREIVAWRPVELAQRRVGRFGFDRAGNLLYQMKPQDYVHVDPLHFIVHTHARENENRYGNAVCSEVFWAWWIKHNFVKWWAVYGEKFSQPTAVGKYPPGTSTENQNKLLAAIEKLRTEYAVVIPERMKIELLEAQRTGTISTYETFVEWVDRNMSECITGQSLATGQGAMGAGSYAQSKTHAEVKQELTEGDAKELMATINGDLVVPFVRLNLGEDVPPPLWIIDYEARDLDGDLGRDVKLVNEIGLPLAEDYFYDRYRVPRPAEGQVLVTGRVIEVNQNTGLGFATGVEKGAPRRFGAGCCPAGSRARRFEVAPEGVKQAEKASRDLDRIALPLRLDLVRAYQALGDRVARELARCESLLEMQQRLDVLLQDVRLGEGIGLALGNAKLHGYLVGAAQVMEHYRKVVAEEESASKRGDNRAANGRAGFEAVKGLLGYEPLEPEAAIEWFAELVPMTEAELSATNQQVQAVAFTVSAVESVDAVRAIRDEVGLYLAQGRTVDEFRRNYNGLRDSLGLGAEKGWKAEQLFRDSVHRAYAAGKVQAARDPEVKGAFPLWQYVAVVDDRTRPEHAALNGFVAEPDDPFWLSHTPPWDFQCRCTFIVLTKGQIERQGIEVVGTVEMPDGSVVDPRGWRTSPGYRGIGF